jgi:hypothetical protein
MKPTFMSRLWPTEGYRVISKSREGEGESIDNVAYADRATWRIDKSLLALMIASIGAFLSLIILIKSPTWRTTCEECTSPFTQQMDFTPHPEFEDFSSKSDFEWDRLLTPNGGFLVREIDNKQENWGISMFHQLHCVQMIRTELQRLMNITTSDDLQPKDYHGMATAVPHDSEHVGHCLDYLRQVCYYLMNMAYIPVLTECCFRVFYAMPMILLRDRTTWLMGG